MALLSSGIAEARSPHWASDGQDLLEPRSTNSKISLSIVLGATSTISCAIDTTAQTKVESLKALIQKKVGIRRECQELRSDHTMLDHNLELKNYHIKDGD